MDIEIEDMPGLKMLEIDFSSPDATVSGLIDLAHSIGKGQKPGSAPAIMSLLLRDMAEPWVNRLVDCVKNEYAPVDGTVAVCRTFSLLLALTILHSTDEGKHEGAVNAIMEIMKDDTMELVKRAAAHLAMQKGGASDPTDLLREMLAKVKPAKGEIN